MDDAGKDDVPISILSPIEQDYPMHLEHHSQSWRHLACFRLKGTNCLHVHGDGKGWIREKLLSLIKHFRFGVMNPHAKRVRQWNQFIVVSCLFAIFIDPLFFYLLSVEKGLKCIVINWSMTKIIVVFRSITDLIYFIHMLLRIRLAFISPESRVESAGDLVKHPRQIALHYLSGFFILDLFIVLPLPQIIVLLILPNSIASSGANYAKNLLRAAVLVQYAPRLYRFLPLLAGLSARGFIFESVWANFIINLLMFVLAGHVVGSCWYLFGLQRVNQCLREACHNSGIGNCMKFMDCGHGNDVGKFEGDLTWNIWKNNENTSACFSEDGFPYGIYVKAVNLTTESSIITRYIYSFFWGFQQISTLAGNQTPSYFVWEVLFTTKIIGLGLLLFALLVGNMQNFLQALGRRRMEWLLRRRDIELWISHRRLPKDLQKKVIKSERDNWYATQGLNEEILMENFPEDLKREIRHHLFHSFIKKVPIFELMDKPMLDAIMERLRQKTYPRERKTLNEGGFVNKMFFILRGKMSSVGINVPKVELSEGDVCGEELLIWCLERYLQGDSRNHRRPEYGLVSDRTVKCLTNVEAFVIDAADLEAVITLFAGFLENLHLQSAIKQWFAATPIQVKWRYGQKRLRRAATMEIVEEAAK